MTEIKVTLEKIKRDFEEFTTEYSYGASYGAYSDAYNSKDPLAIAYMTAYDAYEDIEYAFNAIDAYKADLDAAIIACNAAINNRNKLIKIGK
tara:strand:+ start:1145 stop:1420 length:276 start_codon:yes stop_codon:yes gene_type:complete